MGACEDLERPFGKEGAGGEKFSFLANGMGGDGKVLRNGEV